MIKNFKIVDSAEFNQAWGPSKWRGPVALAAAREAALRGGAEETSQRTFSISRVSESKIRRARFIVGKGHMCPRQVLVLRGLFLRDGPLHSPEG